MRPDDRELDDEIRGHLALSVKERIERGEDPEAARLAALREFGYVPAMRDSMRRVWYSRWFDAAAALGQDMRVGLRSLLRAKGLAATVVVTLALGIGANAAIFSVVRGVLLRPLVNRGEDRLIYIRQSAPGLGAENMTFSVPEIDDFKSRVTDHRRVRRLLDHRLHDDRPRRAPRREGRRRRRLVLRRDGPAPGARPPAERVGRWPQRGGRGGADASLLDDLAQQRSVRDRQDRSGSVRAPPRWSASSSRRCRIRPTPRSSRTW